MKIYNTMTRTKEELVPIDPGEIRWVLATELPALGYDLGEDVSEGCGRPGCGRGNCASRQ